MLKAIASAVKAAFRALKSVAAFPFKLLGAIGGGSAMPEVEEHEPATVEEMDVDSIAARIMTWAVGCVRTRGMEPAPSSLPPSVREWLQGLDYKEAVLLVDAGRMGIQAHISGGALQGVPPTDVVASVMPVWRKANAALRDAQLSSSQRWQKLSARDPLEAAGPDAMRRHREPSAEPEDEASPGYVPTFA